MDSPDLMSDRSRDFEQLCLVLLGAMSVPDIDDRGLLVVCGSSVAFLPHHVDRVRLSIHFIR